jgi:hypothetical protein
VEDQEDNLGLGWIILAWILPVDLQDNWMRYWWGVYQKCVDMQACQRNVEIKRLAGEAGSGGLHSLPEGPTDFAAAQVLPIQSQAPLPINAQVLTSIDEFG